MSDIISLRTLSKTDEYFKEFTNILTSRIEHKESYDSVYLKNKRSSKKNKHK